MNIIHERPPNFDALVAAGFPIVNKPILFAWGDIIYNPGKVIVPLPLQLHEAMHGERQLAHSEGIEGWWQQYVYDDAFRLEEEVLAHQVEYRSWYGGCGNRHQRRNALKAVAKKLSAPLYGRMISPHKARLILREAIC